METQSPAIGPPFTYRLTAYLKWGGPRRQFREDEPGLPDDFIEACASWRRMAAKGTWDSAELRRMHGVVVSHLECVFVPSNLKDGTTLHDPQEFTTDELIVVKVDFSEGAIPQVCARVWFELSFTERLPVDGISAWQEVNDWLDWAVVFRYRFEYASGDEVIADYGHTGLVVSEAIR